MIAQPSDRDRVVLVADDDEDILALVTLDLEADGFKVLAARDGDEALRLALEQGPNLVILDVVMPRLSGYEVATRIREDDALGGTPVILLTAGVEPADILRGFRAGADDYVTKPFNLDELRTRIRALLSVSEARIRAAGSNG